MQQHRLDANRRPLEKAYIKASKLQSDRGVFVSIEEPKLTVPATTRAVLRSESRRLLDFIDPLSHVKPVHDVSKAALAERKKHAKRRVIQQLQRQEVGVSLQAELNPRVEHLQPLTSKWSRSILMRDNEGLLSKLESGISKFSLISSRLSRGKTKIGRMQLLANPSMVISESNEASQYDSRRQLEIAPL